MKRSNPTRNVPREPVIHNESGTLSSKLVELATFATYFEWCRKYTDLPGIALTTEIDIKATERRRSNRAHGEWFDAPAVHRLLLDHPGCFRCSYLGAV